MNLSEPDAMRSTDTRRHKVMVVFGTRPEAVKLAPVIKALARERKRIETVLVASAQHRQMLDQVLDVFGITPDADMSIMRAGQTLGDITSSVLKKMRLLLCGHRPDMVMVQGDTTTAMAASLASFYEKVPVAHVEAGLRSFDRFNPYPEEVNRRVISSLADLHFAPTDRARDNLIAEGVAPSSIHVTGNTVVDALNLMSGKASGVKVRGIDLKTDKLLLVTSHRRENWAGPLKEICVAIRDVAVRFPEVKIIYPVHLNPAVAGVVRPLLKGIGNVHLTGPLDYITFIALMKASYLILTDSGGVQEEAPTFGKPVLVLRKVTERPEAYEAGYARVIGTGSAAIVREVSALLGDRRRYDKMVATRNPYGDGKASPRIAKEVAMFMYRRDRPLTGRP